VVDFASKSDKELQDLIANFETKRMVRDPIYSSALCELEKRRGKGLELSKSKSIIFASARNGEFLSFKQVAQASEVEWVKARHNINKHLDTPLSYAFAKGWPMITAIVVNQEHLQTGVMVDRTLPGFVNAVRKLTSVDIGPEPALFVRNEQRKVFDFAREHPDL
jgi:hypothetical protein